MQRQCTSEHDWCGRCAERKHTLTGEKCERGPRCLNCRDPSGRPEEGHCAYYKCCKFPATIEMRKQALSRREQDPWWWDPVFEEKKRKAAIEANEGASQKSACASTVENKATYLSDRQTDSTSSIQSPPRIIDLFPRLTDQKRGSDENQESPPPSGAANSEMDDAESIPPEMLSAPSVCLLPGHIVFKNQG